MITEKQLYTLKCCNSFSYLYSGGHLWALKHLRHLGTSSEIHH